MADRDRTGRVHPGSIVAHREFESISGARVAIPDAERLVHLQFRRFAGCPICDLHLRTFVARHDELRGAGVREVVVFHSSREALLKHESELPFDVVPDPEKRLYAEFGVAASPRALLDPRAWGAIVAGVVRSLAGILRDGRPVPPVRPAGGSLGLPGDFLIAPDGRVVAVKYGEHAFDQWSVDDVLERARAGTN